VSEGAVGSAGDDRESNDPEQCVEEILIVTNTPASAATPAESEGESHTGMLGRAHAERNTAFAGFSAPYSSRLGTSTA
jgi:hypothetical protein